MLPKLFLMLGDVAGISPEVTVKALSQETV